MLVNISAARLLWNQEPASLPLSSPVVMRNIPSTIATWSSKSACGGEEWRGGGGRERGKVEEGRGIEETRGEEGRKERLKRTSSTG